MDPIRVAVLITSHNRCNATLTCLDSLRKQVLPNNVQLEFVLVDAGSSDGTREAVSAKHSQVRLIAVGADVFWNQGMRIAFSLARSEDYDFYLWLNDDTVLYDDAIKRLVEFCLYSTHTDPLLIAVGTTRDPVSGKPTYGGNVRLSKVHPLKFSLVPDSRSAQPADTMNGNCVLISRDVACLVGNLSSEYSHAFGDFDYGLRARRLGVAISVIPGFVGECRRNGVTPIWLDGSQRLSSRWQQLKGPKGLPPKEWYKFCHAHAGLLWPIFFALPYVRVLLVSVVFRWTWRRQEDT